MISILFEFQISKYLTKLLFIIEVTVKHNLLV